MKALCMVVLVMLAGYPSRNNGLLHQLPERSVSVVRTNFEDGTGKHRSIPAVFDGACEFPE
jgi:hypothetical protein